MQLGETPCKVWPKAGPGHGGTPVCTQGRYMAALLMYVHVHLHVHVPVLEYHWGADTRTLLRRAE
jgi:hypothetical protein